MRMKNLKVFFYSNIDEPIGENKLYTAEDF
jgi:hypothetical protein